MRHASRWLTLAAMLAMWAGTGGIARAGFIVEFSEVDLPSPTDLTGTSYFTPYGLGFQDSFYGVDARFVGAGVDNRGITTVTSNVGAVLFTTPVNSLTVNTVRINTDIFVSVLDAGGNVLQTQSATGVSGTLYDTFSFSGLGSIARLEFHDGTGFVGIGRLEYTPTNTVPEPSTLVMGGTAALICLGAARRLRRVEQNGGKRGSL
jgi:hypothetical protein